MDNHFENTFQGKPLGFTNPEQEVAFLREQLRQKEQMLQGAGTPVAKEQLAENLIENYKQAPAHQVLDAKQVLPPDHVEGIVLQLKPEAHDETTTELLSIMMEKGVKNALEVVRRMNNPHIDDDFYRFLVQYLAAYHEIPGLRPSTELFKEINVRLFEVTLPRPDDQKGKGFKELVNLMEQFFAGMQAIGPIGNPEHNWYTLEIALSNDSDHIVFYVCVSRERSDLLEKVVLGLYPTAKLEEITNDYNIFNPTGGAAGAYAKAATSDMLTIKTYEQFETDPIDLLLNAFSKLKTSGEGAAIQITVCPTGDRYIKEYGKVLDRLRKGEKLKDIDMGLQGHITREAKNFGKATWSVITDLAFGSEPEKDKKSEDKEKEKKYVDEVAIESITQKLKSTVLETNIRIIASAENQIRAQGIVQELESAFHQFGNTSGNSIHFKQVPSGELMDFFHKFSYREMDYGNLFHLNFHELATLFHFPAATKDSPQLKQAKSGASPAPMEMGNQGVLLGYNEYRGKVTPIHFSEKDRLRHFYVIGQTGVGKTQIFLKMLIQDIKNGEGCCFIDPHGSDIQTLLAHIPPERIDDVIYFDPSHIDRPMGLNMMEYDYERPQQKSLVISELMGIFEKLFDMKAQGGAMFGQYFRNSALLVMEDPESGNTLMEITRVLSDKAFRDMKLAKCKNPIITEFWKGAEKTTGDQGLENFVPYISGKFDDFISNEFLRPIVLQEKSAFDFRKVMDEKKILLVNLSKGLLGEKNANLIGLIMIGKLQMAAMSRAEAADLSQFPPFYVYLDEFQNVVTESIAAILSEARKYKLVLNMAHQYLKQLPDYLSAAVFGNVGSMAFFRINDEDAKTVEPRIVPTFTKDDVLKLDNGHCIASMLVNGRPTAAFNIDTVKDGYVSSEGNAERLNAIKQLSYMKYGRPRAEVEDEIIEKFRNNM